MTRLLLVEDDPALVRTLTMNLEARGFVVEASRCGQRALQRAREEPPDLMIVDLGLPDVDGADVVRAVRAFADLPVLILSARDDQQHKVAGLDAGADDYVTKPFALEELLARLRALLRRAGPGAHPGPVCVGDLTIDAASRRVERAGVPVHLTPTEWNLLEVLVRARGGLVPQRELLRAVWGPKYTTETNYLRVYLAQLRRKLEDTPSRPRHLLTEPGVGYRFQP